METTTMVRAEAAAAATMTIETAAAAIERTIPSQSHKTFEFRKQICNLVNCLCVVHTFCAYCTRFGMCRNVRKSIYIEVCTCSVLTLYVHYTYHIFVWVLTPERTLYIFNEWKKKIIISNLADPKTLSNIYIRA